jgi:sugar lactone lactonase YvrE
LSSERYDVAESPVWRDGTLWWTDIPRGRVFAAAYDGETLQPATCWVPDELVGAVIPVDAKDAYYLGRRSLGRLSTGETLQRLLPDDAESRLNDAAVDPDGAIVVGTASEDGDRPDALMRIQPDGRIEVLDADLSLANGIAWSLSGQTIYYADSRRRTIWARRYGTDCGDRRTFIEIPDGMPDGLCVDAEDQIWVAVWGAGEVRRFSPQGNLTARIGLDTPNVSSVAFAGEHFDTLIITTALNPDKPDSRAGALYAVTVNVPGLPTTQPAIYPKQKEYA